MPPNQCYIYIYIVCVIIYMLLILINCDFISIVFLYHIINSCWDLYNGIRPTWFGRDTGDQYP